MERGRQPPSQVSRGMTAHGLPLSCLPPADSDTRSDAHEKTSGLSILPRLSRIC
jgi:hypothetical protein